jgi:hypothetical protein
MGACTPKSTDDLQQLNDLLAEMEDVVKDAILTGEVTDIVLSNLIEITTYSKVSDRPLFSDPLVEPVFYRRYFSRWVVEGLEERMKADKANNVDLKKMLGDGATASS